MWAAQPSQCGGKGLAAPTQALGPEDGWHYLKGKDFGRRPQLKMAPRGRYQLQSKPNGRVLLWSFSFSSICNSHLKVTSQLLNLGAYPWGDGKIYVDLEEALGYIFGCFREDFGPLKFFFHPLLPIRLLGYASKKAARGKKKEVGSRQKELIRPVVLIKLRGVIFRIAILHSNSA